MEPNPAFVNMCRQILSDETCGLRDDSPVRSSYSNSMPERTEFFLKSPIFGQRRVSDRWFWASRSRETPVPLLVRSWVLSLFVTPTAGPVPLVGELWRRKCLQSATSHLRAKTFRDTTPPIYAPTNSDCGFVSGMYSPKAPTRNRHSHMELTHHVERRRYHRILFHVGRVLELFSWFQIV